MQSFSFYQFLVPLFAILMLAKAYSRFLRHTISFRELLIWIIIWTGISLVSLFPDVTITSLARVTGVKSGINALIFFALVILFYGYLRLFYTLEEQERKLTELVRKLALQDLNQKIKDAIQNTKKL